MTVPDCRCQDTARPMSRSSSRESQWGQHGFLPRSWSGSAVLALGGNFSCSKPARTWEQGISWNTQGNYAIRTLCNVTTTGGQRENFLRHRCWLSSCLSYSARLLLYVPSSCKKPFHRQIRFSAVWHLAEQCLPWQNPSLVLLTPGCLKTDEHWASPAALESMV